MEQGSNGNDNGPHVKHLIRHVQMFWIAAGVTIALMAWFTLAFFRNEWNMLDVPAEVVFIGLGFIASYVAHNRLVVQNKCPDAKGMPGHLILIAALVWTGILMTLYQTKTFERVWGMEEIAVPGYFYRFLEFLAGIFGFSSIWNFFPRTNGTNGTNGMNLPNMPDATNVPDMPDANRRE